MHIYTDKVPDQKRITAKLKKLRQNLVNRRSITYLLRGYPMHKSSCICIKILWTNIGMKGLAQLNMQIHYPHRTNGDNFVLSLV